MKRKTLLYCNYHVIPLF